MDGYNVLRVLFKPFIHIIDQFEQNYKWRSVMVLPVEVTNTALKSIMVISFLAYIKNMVFTRMTLI
jgi:hypothetical protein